MSVGLQFLQACLETGGQMIFRRANAEWFLEAEQPAFRFIQNHVRTFGRLPSPDTVRQSGVALMRADEPPDYYFGQLSQRAIYYTIQRMHPDFLSCITNRDMVRAVETLSEMLRATRASNPSSAVTNLREQAEHVLRQYDQAQRIFQLIGLPTGYECVDEATDGLQPGDLALVAGRPGIGKTHVLMRMAGAAWAAGYAPLFVSMEMSALQISRRFVGHAAQINPRMIRSGRLSTRARDVMVETIERFDDMPPFHIISGDLRQSTDDIDRVMEELSPDGLFVDAGYLVTSSRQRARSSSRRELITDVAEEFKSIATRRQKPATLSVQFNRTVSRRRRGDDEDMLGSIAESDALAQLATVAIGVRLAQPPFEMSRRELHLMKNRDGEQLAFEIAYQHNPPNFDFIRMINLFEDGGGNADAIEDQTTPPAPGGQHNLASFA